MLIKRIYEDIILSRQIFHKITILYGPRQVGKTTLIQQILKKISKKTLSISTDETKYIDIFESLDKKKIGNLISGYEILFLDEAQRITNIGLALKIIHENFPEIKIFVTGSSSLDLANNIKEPLTGRTLTYNLYPISFLELSSEKNSFELQEEIGESLIYGLYPEIYTTKKYENKEKFLKEIKSSYLYKDLLALETIKHPKKLEDLVRILAYQIGQEVSLNELSRSLSIDIKTIERYIDLLEKTFVIFRIGGFSRNLRKEVSKMNKIYFYDLGIRNAVIDNFKPLKERNDVGQLWENFLICERRKTNEYLENSSKQYFWRTYTGAELDYIEEKESTLYGYEIKRNKSHFRKPTIFLETYPNSTIKLINQENGIEFILNQQKNL